MRQLNDEDCGASERLRWQRRILRPALLALTCCLSGRSLVADVSIEGRVTLPVNHYAPVMNKRYEIVTKGGVLSTNPPVGVVYLEGTFTAAPAHPDSEVAQKDMEFVPALLAIQTGTKVAFPNEDDMYHNIFSYSPAKRFDLGRYRSDERPIPSVLFDKPGLVVLHCDIHEHMRGLILILSSPYFVVTDSNGHYRLSGLPVGHYTLKVWVDSRTTLEHSVDLVEGAPLRVDFP